jgi:transcriptional regulator with XRE-family HTH domain
MELVMPTPRDRHPGGRPRTREASALFLRVEAMAKRRGIHLDELAERAGLSRTVFYTLKDPKVSTARAIADALGITLDRLTRDQPASKRASRQRSA